MKMSKQLKKGGKFKNYLKTYFYMRNDLTKIAEKTIEGQDAQNQCDYLVQKPHAQKKLKSIKGLEHVKTMLSGEQSNLQRKKTEHKSVTKDVNRHTDQSYTFGSSKPSRSNIFSGKQTILIGEVMSEGTYKRMQFSRIKNICYPLGPASILVPSDDFLYRLTLMLCTHMEMEEQHGISKDQMIQGKVNIRHFCYLEGVSLEGIVRSLHRDIEAHIRKYEQFWAPSTEYRQKVMASRVLTWKSRVKIYKEVLILFIRRQLILYHLPQNYCQLYPDISNDSSDENFSFEVKKKVKRRVWIREQYFDQFYEMMRTSSQDLGANTIHAENPQIYPHQGGNQQNQFPIFQRSIH